MKKLWLSPKVNDAVLSFKDGPNGGYVRWKCVWMFTDKTAVAGEWWPMSSQAKAMVKKLMNEVNQERRAAGL